MKKTLNLILKAFLLSLLHCFYAFAGIEGRLESSVEADNRLKHGSAYLEEQADLVYREREGSLTSGFSGAVRLGDEDSDGRVYQLYLEKGVGAAVILKGGRFERGDGSGFYTIDGAAVRRVRPGFSLELYGGRPERIEDYRSTSARLVIGGDGVFSGDHLTGRLGYQHFNGNDVSERLMWGVRTSEGWNKALTLGTAGTYLPETGDIETFDAEMEGRPAERSLFSLSYSLYQPDKQVESFRERFFREYATGREEETKAGVHFRAGHGTEIFGRVRRVSHNSESNGYGGTIGAGIRNSEGTEVRGEVDTLYLEGEKAVSLYLASSVPLTYDALIRFEMAVQRQEKRTTGENNAYGCDAEFRKMLKGDLYVSGYGMYMSNSRMDDEYRVGMRVTLLIYPQISQMTQKKTMNRNER